MRDDEKDLLALGVGRSFETISLIVYQKRPS